MRLIGGVLVGLAGCGGGGGGHADARPADAGSALADATTIDAAPLPASGSALVAGCASLGTGTQSCFYRYVLSPEACQARACRKLVIFFAGGEQRCDLYDGILNPYRDDGYVAACAQLFEDGTPTDDYPYHAEASRVDAVIRAIVADATVGAAWSGEYLLIAGVSHGATAPPLAMAREDYDDAASWKGTVYTAACFFDGIYDIRALDDFVGTGAGGSECTLGDGPVTHSRVVGRYYPEIVIPHGCTMARCACAPGHSADMELDSIVDTMGNALAVPVSSFAIADWKLVECGSALDACRDDIIPAPPIQALCSLLDADAAHACEFASLPVSSHVDCAGDHGDECRLWFDSRLP